MKSDIETQNMTTTLRIMAAQVEKALITAVSQNAIARITTRGCKPATADLLTKSILVEKGLGAKETATFPHNLSVIQRWSHKPKWQPTYLHSEA